MNPPSSSSFERNIKEDRCEEALLNVPENQTSYKVASVAEQAGGTLISYSFIGAAYTAQILWDATVGLTSAIVLCAPGIILNATSKTHPSPSTTEGPTCLSADIKKFRSPKLGQTAVEKSKSWRCPNLSGLAGSLRSVAQCYAKSGSVEGRQKALNLLTQLKASGGFYSCMSAEDIRSVDIQIAQLGTEPAH